MNLMIYIKVNTPLNELNDAAERLVVAPSEGVLDASSPSELLNHADRHLRMLELDRHLKQGNVLLDNTLDTFYLQLYGVGNEIAPWVYHEESIQRPITP